MIRSARGHYGKPTDSSNQVVIKSNRDKISRKSESDLERALLDCKSVHDKIIAKTTAKQNISLRP